MATILVDDSDGEKKKKIVAPAAGPRPDAGPMDDSEFKSIVDGVISAASKYIDGEVSPERAKATDYYMGRPFGNEEPGRSQFISTEVRDGIQAVIPAMLRVVFGAERAVEFTPPSAEDVDSAEQATDYVHMVFAEDNPGFVNVLGWIKDGLARKMGIAKWWWDETTEVTQHKAENVDEMGLQLLASDEEIEITRVKETGTAPDGAKLHEVEFKHTVTDGRARWTIVPPDEFIYLREDRSLPEATYVGHRMRKTRGELIALGVSEKDIDEHGGDDPAIQDNEEVFARSQDEVGGSGDETEAGKANEKHLYVEGFARIDYDGDGIAELRKICALGPGHYPVLNDPADEVNFAVFVPDPEPHTMSGLSWADRLMDLQLYKSMLMRGISDSLAAAIFPRIVYQSGNANLADILNNAMGAPIRVSGDVNASLREFAHPFLGKEALPVVDLIDGVNERRTGQNRGASTLDADALQSSTPGAVSAAVSASQAQQELLVRIFAEMALKPLFKGLLRLLVTHQPRSRMVRLRNKWVPVDPRSWNINMDATVNVALGTGLVEEKVATLDMISTKQMEIMSAAPDNPIVGWKELRDTLAEITELRGRKNSQKYWKPFSAKDEQAMKEAQANQPPPPSPEMVVAQAQAQKVQADIQLQQQKAQQELAAKQAELALKLKMTQLEDQRERERAMREDDRERDRMATDFNLEVKKLELEHHIDLSEHQLNADIALTRATAESGPEDPKAGSEGAPRPKKRRRKVTVNRGDGRPPLEATIEDEDDHDEVSGS